MGCGLCLFFSGRLAAAAHGLGDSNRGELPLHASQVVMSGGRQNLHRLRELLLFVWTRTVCLVSYCGVISYCLSELVLALFG